MQTTITAWALPYDAFIFYSAYKASLDRDSELRTAVMISLAAWTFLFSKTVKLWGHFFRYPADVMYIPVYIAFGYLHGIIKAWGLLTLSEVSGKRAFFKARAMWLTQSSQDHLGQQRRRRHGRPCPYDTLATLRLRPPGRPQVGNFRVHERRYARPTTCLRNTANTTKPLTLNDALSRLTTLLFTTLDTQASASSFPHARKRRL